MVVQLIDNTINVSNLNVCVNDIKDYISIIIGNNEKYKKIISHIFNIINTWYNVKVTNKDHVELIKTIKNIELINVINKLSEQLIKDKSNESIKRYCIFYNIFYTIINNSTKIDYINYPILMNINYSFNIMKNTVNKEYSSLIFSTDVNGLLNTY